MIDGTKSMSLKNIMISERPYNLCFFYINCSEETNLWSRKLITSIQYLGVREDWKWLLMDRISFGNGPKLDCDDGCIILLTY